MKKMHKAILSVLIILAMVSTATSYLMANGVSSVTGYVGAPTTVGITSNTTPNLYMQVCCIEQSYMVTTPTENKYFQLPITVKILDANAKPVSNVEVNIKIVNGSNTVWYPDTWLDTTTTTDSNGIAEFVYSKLHDNVIYDDVKVDITATNGIDTAEYSKYIEVIMD
jgi:hypothetical protein